MIKFKRVNKTQEVEEKTVKKVYCLYRVSTKGQVDKDDILMQKQTCREFAERQSGWTIKYTRSLLYTPLLTSTYSVVCQSYK